MFPEGLPYDETGLGTPIMHSIYTHLTSDLVDEATLVAPQGFTSNVIAGFIGDSLAIPQSIPQA
jgi:hypothetical protein